MRHPENKGKAVQKSPKNNSQSRTKKKHEILKQETYGQLVQIEEVEAEKEQTNNKTSQRQSQVGEEELGAGGVAYAINAEEEDESMQRDTAFMNDKKYLK